MKKTTREQLKQHYYEKIAELEKLMKEINTMGDDLANETRLITLRLYKEQNDQLEEIRKYFQSVNMPEENNTNEAILSVALDRFYKFTKELHDEH
ncbi:hypothetical protein LC040_09005 [Bacillus tianshenii]|nr:hypothetical protein LC040_09005 [Bacillus tianshenii]